MLNTISEYFSYILSVNFIGEGDRRTPPPTTQKKKEKERPSASRWQNSL